MLIRKLSRFLWIASLGVALPLCAESTPAFPSAPAAAADPEPDQAQAPIGRLTSLVSKATAYLGRPYRHGGVTPSGFDCSGFVHFVFSSIGVDLNRSSGAQARQGDPVDLNHLLPGDLLFFSTRGVRKGISHVAIYIGNGKFIHASNWGGPGKRCVRFGELATRYFSERLVSARRVIDPLDPDSKTP